MSTILATGGLGFIGSHTCINLISHGCNVIVIDSLLNSSIDNLAKIKNIVNLKNNSRKGEIYFYEGDLRNTKWLEGIFEKQILLKKPIDSVIHFAGLKSVEESVFQPLHYWNININAILSLLSVMVKFNCNILVFSSSATIYKAIEGKKLCENAFQDPINPYGNTKSTIEKILNDLYQSEKNNWKIINLRYFNPVSSHDSGMMGEEPKNKPSNLFPVIEKVALGELPKLPIFGNDWSTKDGTCVRDYIHIMDLSEAHYAAYNFLKENNPQYLSVNIGTGRGLSVLDLIQNYSRVNKISIPYEFVERRKGDVSYVVADNSLALKLLNWKPIKTTEDICRDSFRYIRNKLSKNY